MSVESPETLTPAEHQEPVRPQGKGWQKLARQLVWLSLWIAVIWMGSEALFAWVIQYWVPRLVSIDKIEHDIQTEVARATQLEPVWDQWTIEPTLFQGLKVTIRGLKLRDNPEAIKGLGVLIPAPDTFHMGVALSEQEKLSIPTKRALVQGQRFRLYIRYWPLLTRQHIQISRIQLDDVRLLAGRQGVFEHYIPVVYDLDYAKKYITRKSQPTYLSDASITLKNTFVSQDSPLTFMLDPKVAAREAKEESKYLPIERVGLHLDDIDIQHLVSNLPLSLHLKGQAGIFRNDTTTSLYSPKLNAYYKQWNRNFELSANARVTGTDPDKAFVGPWGPTDLKEFSFKTQPSSVANFLNPESVMVEGRLQKTLPGKIPQHGFQVKGDNINLANLSEIAQTVANITSNTARVQRMPLLVAGATSFNLSGNLQWPNALNQPVLVMDKGDIGINHAAIRYQSDVPGNQKPVILPILDDLDGKVTLDKNKLAFDHLNVLIGKSKLAASGNYAIQPETLDANIEVHKLDFNTLLQSVSQLQMALSRLSPQAVPADAYNALAQWRNGEVVVNGLLDANLAFKGPVKQLDYTGTVDFSNGMFKVPQAGLDVSDVLANVDIDHDIRLTNLRANVLSVPVQAMGSTDKKFQRASAAVTARQANLAKIFQTLKTILPPEQQQSLAMVKSLSGTADAALDYQYVASNRQSPNKITGHVNVAKFAVTPEITKNRHSEPVVFDRLNLQFNGDKVILPKSTGHWGPIPLNIAADVLLPKDTQSMPKVNATLDTGTMPTSMFRDQSAFFKQFLPADLDYPTFWNMEGTVALKADMTEKEVKGSLNFQNAGVSCRESDLPFYGLTGTVHFAQSLSDPSALPSVTTERLDARYGNSPVRIVATHGAKGPVVQVRGRVAPLTLNHYLTSSSAVYANYEIVPFRLEMAHRSQANMPAGVYGGRLFVALNRLLINPPEGSQETSTNNGQPLEIQDFPKQRELAKHRSFLLSEFGVNLMPTQKSQYPLLQLYPSRIHFSDFGDIVAQGEINNTKFPSDLTQLLGEFHVITSPEIDLKGIGENFRTDIFKGAKGTVAADMTVSFDPKAHPQRNDALASLNGWVELRELGLPQYLVDDITGSVQFENNKAKMDFPSVKFQGASLSLQAESPQTLQTPMPLKNVKIQGSQFSIPELQEFNNDVVEKIVVENVVRRFSRPWQEGDAMVPVEFRDAEVSLNEVIYQNILLENLKGKLTVLGNSFIQLSDTTLDLAGGKMSGYLEMNPFDNNFISIDMQTKDVKANALTRALLGVTNQVFGDVNATIRYSTQGKSDQEMLQNANGTVKMEIANGRLPALSSVETLLTAANLLRGGVLGFNFNNFIRTLTPFRARYFAALSGDLRIADKKLHTDNLLSDGENLDLLMQGTVTMDDGMADMIIEGRMNQDVAGDLGILGKFSIGRLLRFIPVLGFNPFGKQAVETTEDGTIKKISTTDPGLLYRIPGLGYVPGLGGPAKDVNRFRIKMVGPPQDPASIKSFGWVKD